MRLSAGLLLACLFAPVLWGQTSIAVIRTPAEIVIGSDSLATHTVAPPAVTCKIFIVGKMAFAFARLAEYHFADLDIHQEFIEVTNKPATVRETATTFENVIEPKLTEALVVLRENNPAAFLTYSSVVLETVFAGFENSTPIAVRTTYLTLLRSDGQISIGTKTDIVPRPADPPDAIRFFFLGENEPANTQAHNDPAIIKSMFVKPVEAAYGFVETEIAAHPANVGPPAAVLEITKKGFSWPYPGKCN
jgi:hypothetical protein